MKKKIGGLVATWDAGLNGWTTKGNIYCPVYNEHITGPDSTFRPNTFKKDAWPNCVVQISKNEYAYFANHVKCKRIYEVTPCLN
jgi:hypothetical protein